MNTFTALLIGCGTMGSHQGRLLTELPGVQLVAVCDHHPAAADTLAAELGLPARYDAAAALAEFGPEIVAIPSSNRSHCELVCLAATAGAKAIYVEKPIAVDATEAERMITTCRELGCLLVVGHQRRLGADLIAIRAAVEQGAIGRLRRIQLQCAGDLLSDGTHLLDSLDFLRDGAEIAWIQASLHRAEPQPAPSEQAQERAPGWRFGHPVEDGLCATIRYTDGVNAEIRTGDCVEAYSAYHCIDLSGDGGRIWRFADPGAKGSMPNTFIDDGRPGTHRASWDDHDWPFCPQPQAGGPWRVLPGSEQTITKMNLIGRGYALLVDSLRNGTPHPMDASVGVRPLQLAMLIQLAAVTGKRVTPAELPPDLPLRRICESEPIACPAPAV